MSETHSRLPCLFDYLIRFMVDYFGCGLRAVNRVFPRPFTHGGTHEGGHRPYGGDLTLIDYIIN